MKIVDNTVKWYWMLPCYELYLMTLEDGFNNREDSEEILQYLRDMENIRPDHVGG